MNYQENKGEWEEESYSPIVMRELAQSLSQVKIGKRKLKKNLRRRKTIC